jgi:hypothetical protein
MSGSAAGGGAFASGALQGVALTGGATAIGNTSPRAVVDATDIKTIRRIADMSHLSKGEPSH